MGVQISEWQGPQMEVQQLIESREAGTLYLLRTEKAHYVARHHRLPSLSAYGNQPTILRAFVEWRVEALDKEDCIPGFTDRWGDIYVEETESGGYEWRPVTRLILEEVN